MRLIDADLLQKTYCDDNCGNRKCVDAMDRCVFIGAVLESPPVPAIPMERIKQVREEIDDYNVRANHEGSDSYLIGITKGLDMAVDFIDNMLKEYEPSAEPARWIEDPRTEFEKEFGCTSFHCSKCGNVIRMFAGLDDDGLPNVCRGCGAPMIKESEGGE